MRKGIVYLLSLTFVSAFYFSACTQDKNLVELAVGTDQLSTLVAAVKAGDLVETLSGEGPFTVFAPTNDAFAALPAGTLETLLKPENKDQLIAILKYHVVPGNIMSTDLSNGQTAATAQGESIAVDLTDGVKISGATVISADIKAKNGVVHVIDKVILPPSMQPKNIVELAVGSESLSTLVAAVKAGGLVETLSGEGPFTVFAPTNEAFAALPAGTLESLLKPENKDQLISILTYHVVSGKVMSSDLSDGQKASTVQGADIIIDLKDGVKINDANVVGADVKASNGVVHIIDKVILPPASN